VPETRLAAQTLHHSVECDELGYDQPPHDDLLVEHGAVQLDVATAA
jgi:hypothetical protein